MSGYTAGRPGSNRSNAEQHRVRIEQAIAREGHRGELAVAQATGCPVTEIRQVWAQLDIINNEPIGRA